jgi:AraC-like DNA-binding protein
MPAGIRTYVSRQQGAPGGYWVRRLGVDQSNPPSTIARARSEWFFSWFHAEVQVRDRLGARSAGADDMILWAPGERQHFGARHAWRNSWLALSGPAANRRLASFPSNEIHHLQDMDGVRYALEALLHELTAYATPNPGIVANLVENLVVSLERQLGRVRLEAMPPWLRAAWAELQRSFADSAFSIERLARSAGMSRSAFTRAFARNLGCPPLEALARLRLDRAQALLAEPGAAIAAVARASGFGDHRYFARVVRRRLGVSPSALRDSLIARALIARAPSGEVS